MLRHRYRFCSFLLSVVRDFAEKVQRRKIYEMFLGSVGPEDAGKARETLAL